MFAVVTPCSFDAHFFSSSWLLNRSAFLFWSNSNSSSADFLVLVIWDAARLAKLTSLTNTSSGTWRYLVKKNTFLGYNTWWVWRCNCFKFSDFLFCVPPEQSLPIQVIIKLALLLHKSWLVYFFCDFIKKFHPRCLSLQLQILFPRLLFWKICCRCHDKLASDQW